jgi:hypothetical protein
MMRFASQRQAGRTEVADGKDGPYMRIAANILNQMKRSIKGGHPVWSLAKELAV